MGGNHKDELDDKVRQDRGQIAFNEGADGGQQDADNERSALGRSVYERIRVHTLLEDYRVRLPVEEIPLGLDAVELLVDSNEPATRKL